MVKSVESKREREKRIVSQMIALYCKKKHGVKGGLCSDCAALDCLREAAKRQMPFYGDKNLLLQLQGALL